VIIEMSGLDAGLFGGKRRRGSKRVFGRMKGRDGGGV